MRPASLRSKALIAAMSACALLLAACGTGSSSSSSSVSTPGNPAGNTTFSAQISEVSGGTLSPPPSGPAPVILVGMTPGALAPFFDSFFAVTATVNLSPTPYAQPSVTWSAGSPLVTLMTNTDQTVTVTGTALGQTQLNVQTSGPQLSATASVPVNVYRTLAVGCEDVQAGAGVAFNADGTYAVTSDPSVADLYSSMSAGTISCQPPATPPPVGTPGIPVTNTLFFPGGGVFFPNGDDASRPIPAGGPRGVYFSQVTTAQWQPALTSLPYLTYLADIAPCVVPGQVQTPSPPCPILSDQILLIKTRTGLFVKLLYIRPRPGYFAGFYQVAGANGFAY